jgi:hypothetical protein
MNAKLGLLIIGIALLLYLIFDSLLGSPIPVGTKTQFADLKNKPVEAKEVDQIVNRHLVTTSKLIEMQKVQREFDLNNPKALYPNSDLVNINKSLDIIPQSESKSKPAAQSADLGARILADSAKEQMNRYQEYQDQQAYILQFKKNAWEGGFYVEVDESGQVLKARPLSEAEKRQPFPEEE